MGSGAAVGLRHDPLFWPGVSFGISVCGEGLDGDRRVALRGGCGLSSRPNFRGTPSDAALTEGPQTEELH